MTVYMCTNCGRMCVVHMRPEEVYYLPVRCPSNFDYLKESNGSKSNWKEVKT